MCEDAVLENGLSLEHVPEHLKTPELCSKAVAGIGRAIEFVPEEKRTLAMCIMAVKDCAPMNLVPAKFREQVEQALQEDPEYCGCKPQS